MMYCYYRSIRLYGLRKTIKTLIQDSLCPIDIQNIKLGLLPYTTLPGVVF